MIQTLEETVCRAPPFLDCEFAGDAQKFVYLWLFAKGRSPHEDPTVLLWGLSFATCLGVGEQKKLGSLGIIFDKGHGNHIAFHRDPTAMQAAGSRRYAARKCGLVGTPAIGFPIHIIPKTRKDSEIDFGEGWSGNFGKVILLGRWRGILPFIHKSVLGAASTQEKGKSGDRKQSPIECFKISLHGKIKVMHKVEELIELEALLQASGGAKHLPLRTI